MIRNVTKNWASDQVLGIVSAQGVLNPLPTSDE